MALKTVAIVGAGPAGCAAGCALATLGVHCTLFESGEAGKEKACGDAFVPDAVDALERLGVNETKLADLGARQFRAVCLRGPEGRPLRVPIAGSKGWVVRRAVIDQHLRSIAARNCEVCYGAATTELEPHLGHNQLYFRNSTTESFAGVVIAAGSASLLSRALAIDGRPRLATALSAYVRDTIEDEDLECYFGPSLRPGYGWRFPSSQYRANIGVCLFSSSPGPRLRSRATQFVRSLGVDLPESWRGGLVQLWKGEGTLWHRSEGIVSCGDAAGLIDPSSGEGLNAALRSGWEAGRSMGRFVQSSGDVRALEAYSDWIRGYFSARYARSTARDFWDGWCGLGCRYPAHFPLTYIGEDRGLTD
jgi:menaquinone-9 beta-reductase